MSRKQPSLNITDELEVVMVDLCSRIPEFSHINPRRILLCLSRARNNTTSGTFAKIVPMRFADGSPLQVHHGKTYALPQIPTPDGDVLYIIYIYFPRFFSQPFEGRLRTLIHELFHIAPAFDGAIRKIGARAHGGSRRQFDDQLNPLLTRYLEAAPPESMLQLLRADLKELMRGTTLCGRAMPLPKGIRIR